MASMIALVAKLPLLLTGAIEGESTRPFSRRRGKGSLLWLLRCGAFLALWRLCTGCERCGCNGGRLRPAEEGQRSQEAT